MQQEAGQLKVDALAEDVKNLKMQIENVKKVGAADARDDHPPNPDPWAAYLRRAQRGDLLKDPKRHEGGGSDQPPAGSTGAGDMLSEEDRRTLIIGGWLQDTRKAVIESEAMAILQLDSVRELLDVDKIAVFGPRRSVGMIKFVQRSGEESLSQVKDRMWKVVKAIAAAKIVLQSTRSAGEDKIVWAAFMKTKAARQRTAHISMIRRVAMNLAADSKNDEGGVLNVEHTQAQAYDMDWNAGTIWCGIHKLGSATHRAPKNSEQVLMSGGWVNLDAVGLIAGCTVDVAKAAFENEL